MRYFLHQPITWVDEITEYILLYITFFGTAWVQRNEGHIVFDLLMERLGEKGRTIMGVVNSVLCIPMCFILIWFGAQVTWDHYQRGIYNPTLLEFPKALVIAVIPVGSFLLLIQFIRRLYRHVVALKMLRKV